MKVDLWPVDGMPPPTTPSRWRRFIERYLPMVVVYLMVATLVAIVLYPHMVVTVPSGYVGVLWKRFGGGTVLDPRRLKNEGFNLILPWNEVFLYDLRLQSFTESYNAISSDGVNLTATVIVRFRLQRNAVPVLHQAIGPNYVKVLAMPGIGSLTREVIAQYNAEQVYSTARQEIQDKIRSLVEARLSEKMMEHEDDEDRQPGDHGVLPALARHRGDAAAFAIHECESRRHRQRQRRLADHPRQCGHPGAARGEHAGERDRHGDQGEHDRCRPGGAVGENARRRIGDPGRKDTTCHFGRFVCRDSRGVVALLVAVQSIRYRGLSFPNRTSGGAEDRGSPKVAARKQAQWPSATGRP